MKSPIPLVSAYAALVSPVSASYNGLPFTLITQGSAQDFNYLQNLTAAQIEGEALQVSAFNAGGTQFLFAVDDGGTAEKLLDQTITPTGGAGPFSGLGYNFQRHGTVTTDLVVEATVGGQAGFYRYDGTNWSLLLATGASMPGSVHDFDRLGEPHSSGSKVAFLGMSDDPSGTPVFRGVYLLDGGVVTKLVDGNDSLPGLGSFDGSSSQVGFDGSLVAFWGISGTGANPPSGIFSVSTTGTLGKLSVSGETIPGTSTVIDSFISPPAVSGGTVYYAATDEGFDRYLMMSDGGAPVLIARNGDTTESGGVISELCSYPPLASGGKVVFDAKVDGLPAIIEYDGSALRTAVVSSDLPQFVFSPPGSMVPADFEGDLLAVRATSGSQAYLYLNQSEPAVPALVGPRSETFVVEPGGSITLSAEVIGKGPLSYSWNTNPPVTTPELVLENLDAATVGQGYYSLRISNANGTVFYQPRVQLNVAPYFPFDLSDKSFFEGQTMTLSLSTPGGVAPFTYQWFKGGEPLPGQTQASLSIPNVTAAAAGDYYVEVTNAKGTSRTATSSVTILPIPPNRVFAGAAFGKLIDDPGFQTTRSLIDLSFFINPVTGLTSMTDLDFSLNGTRILEIDGDGMAVELLTRADMEVVIGETLASVKLAGHFPNGDALIHSAIAPAYTREFLHRMTDTGFTLLADTADLPVATATPFDALYYFRPNVVGDRVVAVAQDGGGRFVAFSIDGGGSATLLLDSEVALSSGPAVSGTMSVPHVPRLDDGMVVNEIDEAYGFVRLWKVGFTGEASVLLEKEITLDGEVGVLSSVTFLGGVDGWAYFNTNFGTLRLKDGTIERFRPSLPLGGDASLDVSIVGGQLFAKSVSETGTGYAIYRFRNGAFEVVHDGEFFDMMPLRSFDLAVRAVRGNEVLMIGTEAFGTPPFLMINSGAGPIDESVEPFVFTSDGVIITIPEGWELYRSIDLKNWSKVEATGTYSTPYDGTEFFRFQN